MTEKDIYHLLKKNWSQRAHLTRIENVASFGVPDLNCACDGFSFWIETKIEHSCKVKIQPTQLAWMAQHLKFTRDTFLLIESADHLFLFESNCILFPNAIVTLNNQSYLDMTQLNNPAYRIPVKSDQYERMLLVILSCLRRQ